MRKVPVGTAIRVRTPASSANLGPGFDSVGLALGVWDQLDVTVVAEPGLRIEVTGSGADGVPRDESHLVYRSMVRGLRELGVEVPSGLLVQTVNAVPHGRGMGSSATAIVSGSLRRKDFQRALWLRLETKAVRARQGRPSRSTLRRSTLSPVSSKGTRTTPRRPSSGG